MTIRKGNLWAPLKIVPVEAKVISVLKSLQTRVEMRGFLEGIVLPSRGRYGMVYGMVYGMDGMV